MAVVIWAKRSKNATLNNSCHILDMKFSRSKKRQLTSIPIDGLLSVSASGYVDGWFELIKNPAKYHEANITASHTMYCVVNSVYYGASDA